MAERTNDVDIMPPRARGNRGDFANGAASAKYHQSGRPRRVPLGEAVRSRQHGVMVPECPECAGPVVRHDRGGPVVQHTHNCSVPARPRTWPKRDAVRHI